MLYIKGGTFESVPRMYSWHIGEALRLPEGPVISFQADGDELQLLLSALVGNIRNTPKGKGDEDYL